MNNQARLRAHMKRLGWQYQDLSDWLTNLGEPVTVRQITNWLATPGTSNHRDCPLWPSLLIESRERLPAD